MAPRRPPEMLDADLAPLMLELALWGTADPTELSWLTPPPPGAVAHARELLTNLGALNAEGHITAHGRQMAELPLHPRLAHMLLQAVPLQLGNLACTLAALLSERDILRGSFGQRNADLRLRVDVLRGQHDHAAGDTIDRAACRRVTRTADLWQRQFLRSTRSNRHENLDEVGRLLALAYPDRIAQRQRGTDARYLMANGRGALFANPDPLGIGRLSGHCQSGWRSTMGEDRSGRAGTLRISTRSMQTGFTQSMQSCGMTPRTSFEPRDSADSVRSFCPSRGFPSRTLR